MRIQGTNPHTYSYMKAKYIISIWAISFIAMVLTIAFSLISALVFLVPFVATSVYIGRHSERMLRELHLDEHTDDDLL